MFGITQLNCRPEDRRELTHLLFHQFLRLSQRVDLLWIGTSVDCPCNPGLCVPENIFVKRCLWKRAQFPEFHECRIQDDSHEPYRELRSAFEGPEIHVSA